MSYNSLHKCLIDNKLWAILSILLLGGYLSVLFHSTFYVPTFDNLDSNVVWYKILAESGMIFASNDAIIPNMMSGLPRASYGSEFDVILWLYYFFEPKTAFIINEIAIHLVAFVSIFVFLKRYIVKPNKYYADIPIFVGALYFSLIPFWSGAGLSIAILPLVTYSLLNIKNHTSSKWDWILLIVLPLYTSFIFLYMFYIIMAGIYLLYDSLVHRKLNKNFFYALLLMGIMFLLSEYRLIQTMFFDTGFVSHRSEFGIYFTEDIWKSYNIFIENFIFGHPPHAQALQNVYLIPLAIVALLLSTIARRFTSKESMVLWAVIVLSFIVNVWQALLLHHFTLPIIFALTILVIVIQKKYRLLPLLLLLTILLSLVSAAFQFDGLKWFTDIFPILSTLNMLRVLFVQPFILAIVLVLSLIILWRKLHFTAFFMPLFIVAQFYSSMLQSFYQTEETKGYTSFEDYYAVNIFTKLKNDLGLKIKTVKFVSYGLEPAILLFNGLHTIDGYSTNYPLAYKHKFRNIFSQYCQDNTCNLYDKWGSKAYIVTTNNQSSRYIKGLNIKVLRFNTQALCLLGTDYMISAYKLNTAEEKRLNLLHTYKSKSSFWDIYIYGINYHK